MTHARSIARSCALLLLFGSGCADLRYVTQCCHPIRNAYYRMTCRYGCVPVEFGEPTDCCEPCDQCGNWVGPTFGGYPAEHEAASQGCASCATGTHVAAPYYASAGAPLMASGEAPHEFADAGAVSPEAVFDDPRMEDMAADIGEYQPFSQVARKPSAKSFPRW